MCVQEFLHEHMLVFSLHFESMLGNGPELSLHFEAIEPPGRHLGPSWAYLGPS